MVLSLLRCLNIEAGMHIREPVALDTLDEPPERRGIGHIRRVRFTGTISSMAPTRPWMSTIIEPESPGFEKTSDLP